ncbi:MAG: hypothetical protein AAF570_08870, partial [Bacteroidota bacterium]
CAVSFLMDRTGAGTLAKKLANGALEEGSMATARKVIAWLSTHGIHRTELAMIQPYFSESRRDEAGLSQMFAGLQRATQERNGDYLASAFVGASSGIVRNGDAVRASETTVAEHAPITVDARPGRGEALAAIFELLRPSSAGNHREDSHQVRAFFMPNTLGEPVIALTFSRSF